MDKSILITAFISVFLVSACSMNVLFKDSTEISGTWKVENRPGFEVKISDTISSYDIFINLIHTDQYPYSNIWLFTTIISPNGMYVNDTIERFLADTRGRWIGATCGHTIIHELPYKWNVRFPKQGKYTFIFEQAMRQPELPGIKEVGIKIRKTELALN
ncbi:MAG: gliding motility lipoprotein GldH [Bacteroidetes bacterium]|nr:gliding motility lipoprotein GldH [Bacteroidota bacterium]